jgi:hypothetical protein
VSYNVIMPDCRLKQNKRECALVLEHKAAAAATAAAAAVGDDVNEHS